jgi:DNA-binding transcriptional ArsR family regulator
MPVRNARAAKPTLRPGRPRGGTASAVPAGRAGTEDLCEVRCIDQEKVERAQAVMPAAEDVAALAETFRGLGDPTRLRLVRALMAEELCVCDLATLVGASQPTVSHSLRALRQLRLVRYRKEGKIAYYAIDDEHVRQLVDIGFAHVAEGAR